MVGWHQGLNGHEFAQTPGNSGEERSLVCCSPGSPRVSPDMVIEKQQPFNLLQSFQRFQRKERGWGPLRAY